MNRRLVRRAAAAAALLLAACADFDGAVDPTFGLPDLVVTDATLERDVQPILDKRCAFGGCHSARTRQANLDLTASASYDALVGRRSTLRPSRTLVVPGEPETSWLVDLIADDEARRGGFARMPLAATPLTANQIATIRAWVARGAPRR